jgi:hypothetical protein
MKTKFNAGALTKVKNKKFWEELIAYFLLKRHRPQIKERLQQFFVAAETVLSSRCLATIWGLHIQTDGRDL